MSNQNEKKPDDPPDLIIDLISKYLLNLKIKGLMKIDHEKAKRAKLN